MSNNAFGGALRAAVCALVLAITASTWASPVHAASNFPDIPVWANPGVWQDSSVIRDGNGVLIFRNRCVGAFKGPQAESLAIHPRAITVRFLLDRRAEARPDFGGYRVYRMTNSPDSSKAVLIRRFSLNAGSELTWNFSRLSATTMNYICNGGVVHDSIVTFVDPDSNGQFIKVCRRIAPDGRCASVGDSVFILSAPPGPHDGFLTWYSVTIERKNTTDPDYEDLFLPDEGGVVGGGQVVALQAQPHRIADRVRGDGQHQDHRGGDQQKRQPAVGLLVVARTALGGLGCVVVFQGGRHGISPLPSMAF